MNKYVEALSSIRFSFGMRAKPKYVYESEKENFDILEELVEKATPKDPPFYQNYDLKKEFWECPTCGSFLCENGEECGHGGYCEHCGQRIGFEEE